VERLLAQYGSDAAMGHIMQAQISAFPNRGNARCRTAAIPTARTSCGRFTHPSPVYLKADENRER
jgi:hypothetical protein